MNVILNSLEDLINLAFNAYMLILIGRILISWVNPDPYNPIVRFLHNATDPVLNRIRRVLPLQFGAFDLTPIVFIFALNILHGVLVGLIRSLAGAPGGF